MDRIQGNSHAHPEGRNGEGILKRAIIKGHFLLSSGLHSEFYFEKFRILEDPKLLFYFSERLASFFRQFEPDRVVGPFTGGAILAYDVARLLSVKAAYAERWKGGRMFRRGFSISGERVVVVDDVLTTGKSLKETLRAVNASGGEVVAVGVMVKRGKWEGEKPFFSVIDLDLPTYEENNCPLCERGVPISVPGKGGV